MIWFLWATHARMDALFFGTLLSYLWHVRWDEAYKAKLLAKRWVFAFASSALLFPANTYMRSGFGSSDSCQPILGLDAC